MRQDGEGWQVAPATMSNINQVSLGTGCGRTLHHYRSWEQPFRRCKVLVSVFTWAPAASPTLNQLLTLGNKPLFQAAFHKTPLSASFTPKPRGSLTPGGFWQLLCHG